MKQQQSQLPYKQIKLNHKSFDLVNLTLTIRYQPILYNNQKQLDAIISLTPNKQLINTPLEIQLRGYSHMQFFNKQPSTSETKSIEVTEDVLNQTDEQLQVNVLMGKSKKFDQEILENVKTYNANDMNQEETKQGEYFLQGCHVLYQIDDKTGERLQSLLKDTTYKYPINFTLPHKLPISMDHIILHNIHIIIKYSIEIKIISVDKQFGKKQYRTLIVPFQIQQPPKQYPYEQLVANQLIRLYHQGGRRRDELMNRTFAKLIGCICPQYVYDRYLQSHNSYKTKFKIYDLFHVELVVVVNTNQNIFLVARSYRQPQVESLTLNRQKQVVLKQARSFGEVPNDLSLVSMKNTQRKHTGLGIYKVQVQMIGELQNICSQSIFKKVVTLNQSNYDMLQGQAVVNLNEYMNFSKSCNSELFVLRYTFNIKPYFEIGEQEGQMAVIKEMQDFVVESNKKQLIL